MSMEFLRGRHFMAWNSSGVDIHGVEGVINLKHVSSIGGGGGVCLLNGIAQYGFTIEPQINRPVVL